MPVRMEDLLVRTELRIFRLGNPDCIVEIIRREAVSVEDKPDVVIGRIVAFVPNGDLLFGTFNNAECIGLRSDNDDLITFAARELFAERLEIPWFGFCPFADDEVASALGTVPGGAGMNGGQGAFHLAAQVNAFADFAHFSSSVRTRSPM